MPIDVSLVDSQFTSRKRARFYQELKQVLIFNFLTMYFSQSIERQALLIKDKASLLSSFLENFCYVFRVIMTLLIFHILYILCSLCYCITFFLLFFTSSVQMQRRLYSLCFTCHSYCSRASGWFCFVNFFQALFGPT